MRIIDHDLMSIQEARILVENAHEAQKTLATFPQAKLDEIVECMARAIAPYAKELAVMSSDETDYGKWQDKYIKNRFACEYVPVNLRGMQCVGIINRDEQKKIMDVGVPMGVIISLCPATSPVSTSIYTALVSGDVGACKTAVEAGLKTLRDMGNDAYSSIVIPRPHEDLKKITCQYALDKLLPYEVE